jgi:hypothetical protein
MDALHPYEEATGGKVNIRKSRTVPIKSWNTSIQIMDIPYYNETTNLGIHITSTIQASSLRSWTLTTAKIRAQAQEAYYRELSMDKRIHCVHNNLMARVWYLAQIYPHRKYN